uniref:Uncharacterized protein n=1 Tax=Arundo donax TaxID=35708 RepID=A0A0A9HLW6_ARUDO
MSIQPACMLPAQLSHFDVTVFENIWPVYLQVYKHIGQVSIDILGYICIQS